MQDSADDMARLECYALLASSALIKRRRARSGLDGQFLRQIVEDSTELPRFVDEGRFTKPAMRASLLHLARTQQGDRLEVSFTPVCAMRNQMARARRSKRSGYRPP